MEENNYIFLAGSDALVYLAKPIHKKIPWHLFGTVHLVRTYLMTDFLNPSLCTHLYTFWMTPFMPLVAYVLNGWPISQPKNI